MSSSSALRCRLDHLVITASNCHRGVEWFRQLSGIMLPEGGQHARMGTHNHLSALSDQTYLEIIAIDPAVADVDPPLGKHRWFALDDPAHQRRLVDVPVFTTWALATNDLDAAIQIAAQGGVDVGVPVSLSRGELHWRVALRPDGSLACDGVFPILIQWPEGMNPVQNMQDQGLRLERLSLTHPEAMSIRRVLDALGVQDAVRVAVTDRIEAGRTGASEAGEVALEAELRAGEYRFTLRS